MSSISDNDFVSIVNDMLELFTHEKLAQELRIAPHNVLPWSKGEQLPNGVDRRKLYSAMQDHPIWETF